MVNTTDQTNSYPERNELNPSGSSLPRIIAKSVWVSSLAAVVGLYYSIIASGINNQSLIIFLVASIASLVVINILVPILMILVTRNARSSLKEIQTTAAAKYLETQNTQAALDELNRLPLRCTYAYSLASVILVVIPVSLVMRIIVGISLNQLLQILIGLLIAVSSIAIVNLVLLDKYLSHPRKILFSLSSTAPKISVISSIQTRLLVIMTYTVIIPIIMLAGFGFQKSINASLPGANIQLEITQFQQQAAILGLMSLVLGITLLSINTRSITAPIQDVVKTLDHSIAGDYQNLTQIFTSDEMSQIGYRLNLILQQRYNSQRLTDEQVKAQSEDLLRRTNQLQAATRIAQETAGAQDLPALLTRTVQLVHDYYSYYHIGIYLLDESRENLILHAASSEGGKKMVSRGYAQEVGRRSLIGTSAQDNRIHIIQDVSVQSDFQANPDLPNTRSLAAIPLTIRGIVIGVLDVQSDEIKGITQTDQDMLKTLSDYISLSIQNVRLIEENRLAVEQMRSSLAEDVTRAWKSSPGTSKHGYRVTPVGVSVTNELGFNSSETGSDQYLEVPISLRGQPIGRIKLRRKSGNEWEDADRLLANDVAGQVALALENSRLLQDAQTRARHEQQLSNLTSRLSLSVDTDSILQSVVQELHQLPNVTEVSVLLNPPESSSPIENPGSGEGR